MPKKNQPSSRPPQPFRVRALVLLDDAPIRRAALAEYLALEREAARLRAQMERFETVDCPAYERWDARTFGPLLTELREISAALGEKQRVLDAIEDEMLWSGCSRRAAYRRVMKLLTAPPPDADADAEEDFSRDRADPDFSGDTGGMFNGSDLPPGVTAAHFDRMSAREKREFRTFFETMAELFAAMSGQPAPSLEDALARDRARYEGAPPPRESAPTVVKSGEERIKKLYRKIVRQLHPDANGEFAPRERELWHELQAAYQARDLERLEAVAARVELGGDAAASARTSIGVLLRITREMREALQSVRRQLARAKKQPAWHFPPKTNVLAPLENRRRHQLERALAESRYALERATTTLEDLARKAAPPRKKTPVQTGGSGKRTN